MSRYYPVTSSSDVQAVTGTHAVMAPTMAAGETWLFVSSTNCYIAQAAAPVATAGDGSMFVPAGVVVSLDGGLGAKLSVIQASANGSASLTRAKVV